MITIESPNDKPRGQYMVHKLGSESEAARVSAGCRSYLYHSHIIDVYVLFVPMEA